MTSGVTQTRLQIADTVHRDSGAPKAAIAPIIAAVDDSTASTVAVETAVSLAGELEAPIVFTYVRRAPAGFLGAPMYQRRLTADMGRGRRVLDKALAAAAAAGVSAEGEILEGSPRRRITEFARARGARLVVIGSRGRKFGSSVSCGVARAASRPVVVAKGLHSLAITGKAA